MAFVKDRQIMGSFIVAEDIIHSWRKDMVGGLLVKLDFEKAYDSLDHTFVDAIMENMEFGEKWRYWIRNCISTPMLSVLVNGSPTKEFALERGLRQGDLLSPFIFNMVVESLSCCFKKAFELNMLRGAVMGDNEVHVSHLQFTNDTILFLEPKAEYLVNVKRILRCFEMASGLKINFHKSCIVQVGKKSATKENWAALIKCKKESPPITYLDLPLGARPGLKGFWNLVLMRIEKRLAPWKKKFLSKGGRLVLIKVVLASIPTYVMSIFKVPVNVAQAIEKLQWSFFWGDGAEKRRMHAVDWATVCKSKRNEGLGIGRIEDKNKGLLMKWVWRFGRDEGSLWKKVICAKYGVKLNCLQWDWNVATTASPFIKAISSLFTTGSSSEKIIGEGLKVVVGSGTRVSFWKDSWNGVVPFMGAYPRIFALAVKKDGFICEFGRWREGEWIWEVELRRRIFDWEVKSFRRCLEEVNGAGLGGLDITILVAVLCARCAVASRRLVDHLFLLCSWAWEVWCKCLTWWRVACCPSNSIIVWFRGWQGLCPNAKYGRVWMTFFYAIAWTIWETRNQNVFRSVHVDMEYYVDLIRFRVAWWFKYHGSGSSDPITILIKNLEIVCIDIKHPKFPNLEAWSPPENDALKFNVDRVANGDRSRAGIGGALYNSNGAVLCSFFASMGAQEAITTEVLAIHKACSLCVEKGIFVGRRIEFISDSREAVSWVNEEGFGSLQHLNLIYDIRFMLASLGNAVVIFNPRFSNSLADALAKKGSWSTGDTVEWGGC
ncbi:hypothetical protein Dsin_008432 [Dipteronia sinensis]|uniref:Reverse transcriptase domain-containing protein n=1 Tax=Dipteronia sinensis TaxID=43782 RepID=A0AAE0EB65_9ROSI|nr:hypothetical protein Dsin_008432 [Dipteronia sinensis]